MYQLNDKQKQWVLSLSGKDLYSKTLELRKQNKVDSETMKQMFAFWLNQHNIRHHEPYIKIISVQPDKQGRTQFMVENRSKISLGWGKYDESISEQSVRNEEEIIWNKNKSQLEAEVERIFNT